MRLVKSLDHRRSEKEFFKRSKLSLISHYLPRSPIAEQYRSIRTSIQFASTKNEVRLISITSAKPGEGKSTTATNLAIVLAQSENKVLLIDADMRKPTCHTLFFAENKVGLSSVLFNMNELSDAIVHTTIPNLDLLTCGPIPPNPAELLDMKRMDWLLNEVRLKYDYIIIDTPPILAVTDAQILAQKCDGVVLVVSSRQTTKENAIKAKDLLLQTGGTLLGVVLNRKKVKLSEYNYYFVGGKR